MPGHMRETEQNQMAQGRLTAVVIAVSASLWLIANWLGPIFGLSYQYAFLVDLIVLAAMSWALVKCFFIWRKSKAKKGK